MNKICIIGNSHMGVLKLAYDEQKKSGIDFYASSNEGFAYLYIEDNKLSTDELKTQNDIKRTKGNEFILLEDYNQVLIYGCRILSTGQNWLFSYVNALSKMYSENCLRLAYIDQLYSAFGFQLAKMIKESNLCEKVTIIPSPLPSEARVVNQKQFVSSTPIVAEKILERVKLIYQNYLAEYGINLLWNPRELLANNGFTTSIKYQRKEKDYVHLNKEGGRIILANIRSYLEL